MLPCEKELPWIYRIPQEEFDSIWVIVNKLTKSTYFFLVKTTYSVPQYAQFYIDVTYFMEFMYLAYQIDGNKLHPNF